ncbi:complex I intermediate-associated protein 84, mitochondrial [Podospora fimiseda]|uniref:Complex I intermediate-associated protein 84, mitochondrial n=1 Tax=Podospora fimiseda TaxID=252190 RepID=A0AAN7BNE6_9PEZI|nr:complex I intermediate-associated protein 84, mitochondrial [Podospora fimiseda]
MRSHLTRNVYRRLLLAGYTRSTYLAPLSNQCLLTPSPAPIIHHPSRRTFFGVFKKPPRELKGSRVEPGYDVLLQFRSLEVENARPPERADLLQGYRAFVKYRRNNGRCLNTTQAFLTVRLLRHLLQSGEEMEGEEDLGFEDLRRALELTTKPPTGKPDNHLELAGLAYGEIEQRTQLLRDMGVDEQAIAATVGAKQHRDFGLLILAMTRYGASLEAEKTVEEYWSKQPPNQRPPAVVNDMWLLILEGLAKEGREEDLLRVYKKSEPLRLGYLPATSQIMTGFYASRDRVEETRYWFQLPIRAKALPTPETYMEIARFAARNNEQEWLQPIIEKLINSKPSKALWDVIFQWAVLVMDMGVEDITQMFRAMSQHDPSLKPDGATINNLISAAIEKKNPYLAERFMALRSEMGLQPTAAIYILQLNYRVDAKDLSGAAAVYRKLQLANDNHTDEDLPILNKYLRFLCSQPKPNLETILNVTADLEQRHATLEPETVAALCMIFLAFDKEYDVIDTLSLHTVFYSLEERAIIRKAFVNYCCNPKISTARVWDAYSLLRQFFPETEVSDRVRLMHAFFNRKRPDMACYIFGHMRGHGNPSLRPTADIYVQALEGLGRYPDKQSLRMVHNMLKMDTTVQPDTRIYNGLMLAYASCEDPDTSMEFWREIINSAEGPTYNSLTIIFRVCETKPYGDREAKEIWTKMQSMDLDVPEKVYDAYCGAVAGNGNLEEVKRVIANLDAKQEFGYGVREMTLAITYNAFPGPARKELFEKWCKDEFPAVWEKTEKKFGKRLETVNGKMFELERNIVA